MIEDTSPLPRPEDDWNGASGEPTTGPWVPHATPVVPPFLRAEWQPPKTGRFTRFLTRGITLTITLTPTVLMFWIFAPDDLKYELKKQARWLPWVAQYAAWWLKQKDY